MGVPHINEASLVMSSNDCSEAVSNIRYCLSAMRRSISFLGSLGACMLTQLLQVDLLPNLLNLGLILLNIKIDG
jgi:hypothetical protein